MSSFKIVLSPKSKNVILNGRFQNYSSYDDLKNTLIENYNKSLFIQENSQINPVESFKLVLIRNNENGSDIYFPEDLNDSIWDNETYAFFKNKLLIREINDAKYRFFLKKVEKLPKFSPKKNSEKLGKALDKYWNKAFKDIISEINVLRFEKTKNEFEQRKMNRNINSIKTIHRNIICCNCFEKDFCGKRFLCSECNNYNLCQECENILNYKKEIHPREHVFIQINKSLEQNNFFKYRNIIGNYNKEFEYISSDFFDLELTVINNGENDLEKCYFLPVRYGEEYLDCVPTIIRQSVKNGMPITIKLCIRKPNKNCINRKTINTKNKCFKGFFRMFTPEGIPFGNIAVIKVLKWN